MPVYVMDGVRQCRRMLEANARAERRGRDIHGVSLEPRIRGAGPCRPIRRALYG